MLTLEQAFIVSHIKLDIVESGQIFLWPQHRGVSLSIAASCHQTRPVRISKAIDSSLNIASMVPLFLRFRHDLLLQPSPCRMPY